MRTYSRNSRSRLKFILSMVALCVMALSTSLIAFADGSDIPGECSFLILDESTTAGVFSGGDGVCNITSNATPELAPDPATFYQGTDNDCSDPNSYTQLLANSATTDDGRTIATGAVTTGSYDPYSAFFFDPNSFPPTGPTPGAGTEEIILTGSGNPDNVYRFDVPASLVMGNNTSRFRIDVPNTSDTVIINIIGGGIQMLAGSGFVSSGAPNTYWNQGIVNTPADLAQALADWSGNARSLAGSFFTHDPSKLIWNLPDATGTDHFQLAEWGGNFYGAVVAPCARVQMKATGYDALTEIVAATTDTTTANIIATPYDGCLPGAAPQADSDPDVTVEKTAVAGPFMPGDVVTWTITISNVGSVATTGGVTITSDTLTGPHALGSALTLPLNIGELGASGSTTSTFTIDVTTTVDAGAMDGDEIINTVVVDTDGDSDPDNNSSTYTETVEALSPDVTVMKTAEAGPYMPGDVVTWTITISNVGAITTTGGVSITSDVLTGPHMLGTAVTLPLNVGDLGVGASTMVVVTTTVDAMAMDGDDIVNTVVVTTANDSDPDNNTSTYTETVEVLSPDVTVMKTAEAGPYMPGDIVTWTITISNVGQIATMGGVSITADTLTGPHALGTAVTLPLNVGDLAVGASTMVVVTTTVDAMAMDGDDLVNTVVVTTANDSDPDNNSSTYTETVTVPPTGTPGIDLVKTSEYDDATGALTYNITLTNTGDLTATYLITDTFPLIDNNVQMQAACNGGAAATSLTDSVEIGPMQSATYTCVTTVMPSLAITKTAAANEVVSGAMGAFNIALTNDGNIGLFVDIVDIDNPTYCNVTGQLLSAGLTDIPCEALPLGVVVTQTVTNRVVMTGTTTIINTASASIAGDPASTVTASASNSFTETASSEDTITPLVPSIDVEKDTNGVQSDTAPGEMIPLGDDVTWTYVVTNNGAYTLTDVTLMDSDLGSIDLMMCSMMTTTLGIGESTTCTMTGTANTLGQYMNTATTVGTAEGTDVTVTDSDDSHYVGMLPDVAAISIEKATNGFDADMGPGPSVVSGSTVQWTYAIANTGNLTITGISVVDSDSSLVVSCPMDTLAPDESMTCSASGIAITGQYTNTGTVTGTGTDGTDVMDTEDSHYNGSEEILGNIGDMITNRTTGAPLAGVTVNLMDASGNVYTATTDASGNYLFSGLMLGEYTVMVNTSTLPDTKITTGEPYTGTAMLTEEAPDDLTQDFDYPSEAPTGSIGDTVFHDLNGDGVYTPGEPVFGGVMVTVTASDGTTYMATTGDDGTYLVDGLPLGDMYTVTIDDSTLPADKQGNFTTTPDPIMLTEAMPDATNQDFGVLADAPAPTGSIGDTVFHDLNGDGLYTPGEPVFGGVMVTVTASDGTTYMATTGDDGTYLVDGLPLGDTYTVMIDDSTLPADKQGNFTAMPDPIMLTEAMPDATNQDFGVLADDVPTGSIGDMITNADSGAPLSNVVVKLTDANGMEWFDTTDATGRYLFENLPAGDYTVAVQTGTVPDSKVVDGITSTSSLTLGEGENNLDQDFAYPTKDIPLGSIGDTIFHDADGNGVQSADEPGLSGVTVVLTWPSGATQTAQTDASGMYMFGALPLDGDYMVMVDTSSLPGDKIMMPSADPEGDGNVTSTVTLDGSSDANTDNVDQDFGFEPMLGSIGNVIWSEENGDTSYTAGVDTPLANVLVILSADGMEDKLTRTDETGAYLFDDLPLGVEYTVTVDRSTLPLEKQSEDDAPNIADPDSGQDSTSTVTLGSDNPDDVAQNFGFEVSAPTAVSLSMADATHNAAMMAIAAIVVVLSAASLTVVNRRD